MIAGSELFEARKNSPFDNSKLKPLMVALLSGAQLDVRRDFLLNLILHDPLFVSWKRERNFLGRVERIRKVLFLCRHLVELKFKYKLNKDEFSYLIYLIDDLLPIMMHEIGFIPFLLSNGTQDQINFWLPKAKRYEVIGCYAQTELGHGSDISSLETTATFSPEDDTWIIDSPTLQSTKWWIGSLGILANHAIVMARMIINMKDHGIYGFIVPIRDPIRHAAFKNVYVGEIGPKMGVNSMDNGFLRFTGYKIPRTNLLMKNVKVDKDGVFSASNNPKLTYIGMTTMRANFIGFSALNLAKGITIGVRYATIRKQFKSDGSKEENQIMTYPSVHSRLLPLLCATYAFCFCGHYVRSQLNDLTEASETGREINGFHLNSFHALTSTLKSFCTTLTSKGLEDIRLACGGHGYSQFSGLPETYCSFVHMATAEGENWLMTQQASRWILKIFHMAKTENITLDPCMQYILKAAKGVSFPKCSVGLPDEFLAEDVIINTLEFRACVLLLNLSEKLNFLVQNGDSYIDAWNKCQLDIYAMSQAHAQVFIIKCYHLMLNGPINSSKTKIKSKQSAAYLLQKSVIESIPTIYEPLRLTLLLLGLYWIKNSAEDLLKSGYITVSQLKSLEVLLYGYAGEVTVSKSTKFPDGLEKAMIPYAIPLVDGLAVPDYVTNSALGSGDGRVYARLWDWVLFCGLYSSPGSNNTEASPVSRNIKKFNLNRTYNRELYKEENLNLLPYFSTFRSEIEKSLPTLEEEDPVDDSLMKDWQEMHSKVILPLVSGSLAKQYESESKL